MAMAPAKQVNSDINTGTVQTNSVGGSFTLVNKYSVEAGNVYIAEGYIKWANDTPGNIPVQIALECPGNNSIIFSVENGTLYTTGTPPITTIFKPTQNGNIGLKVAQFSGLTQTLNYSELKVYKLT